MLLKSLVQNVVGQKNPTMLRVGVAQVGCNPRVDFDGLDAPESRFLKPRANPKKKYNI
jgi:hypothetical protein